LLLFAPWGVGETLQEKRKARWFESSPRRSKIFVEGGTTTGGKLLRPFAYEVLALTLFISAAMPILEANGASSVYRTENRTPPPSFEPVTVRIPVVLFNRNSQEGLPFRQPNTGDILHETLTVRYDPSGSGASVTLTPNPGQMIEKSLHLALLAAAQAVGYPSQYVHVDLVYPPDPLLRRPIITGDGLSGGGIYAVAIAAALLGDTLQPDVCMTGTIQPDLTIGRIGGVEGKLTGCKYAKAKDMIIPAGQLSMQLDLDARSAEIRVHEVDTLAEAYAVATGQPLRRVGRQ
jgi:hypothetical protein